MSNPQVGCLNMANEFTDYALNIRTTWTRKRLGRLLNNITKVNVAIEKGKREGEENIHIWVELLGIKFLTDARP